MSGGHFDYACFRISQFADDLGHEIDKNGDTSTDQYGTRRGAGFDAATILRLREAHRMIELAGRLAREVEWLYSDDTGPEYCAAQIDKFMQDFLSKTGE